MCRIPIARSKGWSKKTPKMPLPMKETLKSWGQHEDNSGWENQYALAKDIATAWIWKSKSSQLQHASWGHGKWLIRLKKSSYITPSFIRINFFFVILHIFVLLQSLDKKKSSIFAVWLLYNVRWWNLMKSKACDVSTSPYIPEVTCFLPILYG
jgi:hypothetical protein